MFKILKVSSTEGSNSRLSESRDYLIEVSNSFELQKESLGTFANEKRCW